MSSTTIHRRTSQGAGAAASPQGFLLIITGWGESGLSGKVIL